MALVRCPKHNIPYNDANPRGCPACAREREGSDPNADAIRELARASQRRSESDVVTEPPPTGRPSRPSPAPPVTPPPRPPEPEEGRLAALLRLANERRILAGAAVVIVTVLVYFIVTAGPSFVEAWDPPQYTGEIRSLPVEPGQQVEVVFAILGARTPRTHPTEPSLARYAYGTDLTVDALNGVIYQITIGVPNWSWRGLRVGLSQRNAEGALALLGAPRRMPEPDLPNPQTLAGYAVYPSLANRPTRTLIAEVRPPNGCFDALVDLMPRALGELVTGDRRYAVIGPEHAPLEWMSTEVRIVNRAVRGPSGSAAC